MWKILIAANDRGLRDNLGQILLREPYELVFEGDGRAVQDTAEVERPALVLLDLQIPGIDGLSICRNIRSAVDIFHTPVIALSAGHTDSAEVETLGAGADDFMSKSVRPEVLLARIKAVLRRTALPAQINTLRAGPIEMDIDRWTLWVHGRPVELTTKEFHLLRELLQAKGRVLPRETLLQRVWEHSGAQRIDTRTVDVHVGRLRRKLGEPGRHIITVRNVGYRLDIFLEWARAQPGERSE